MGSHQSYGPLTKMDTQRMWLELQHESSPLEQIAISIENLESEISTLKAQNTITAQSKVMSSEDLEAAELLVRKPLKNASSETLDTAKVLLRSGRDKSALQKRIRLLGLLNQELRCRQGKLSTAVHSYQARFWQKRIEETEEQLKNLRNALWFLEEGGGEKK
ncbi:Hypothetical predicted protein [Lecanosticta acicola]|uniref:Uncharacterized protein n=1 Tax=Lecanosticta acicola TaxID=111012 RepID=A0AAI8Z5Q3_9PEZI|nr:Hypothetical predicted protein [Lecanosticta acicola]